MDYQKEDYQKELFAQSTPYLQWLREHEPVAGSDKKDTGKPLDVFPFSSCEDSVEDILGGPADKERIYLFAGKDGVLQEGACARIAQVFSRHEQAMLVYADEDYYGTLAELYGIEEREFGDKVTSAFCESSNGLYRGEPWFKPDFSPDTLEAFFYIGNLFAVRGQAIAEITDALGAELSLCGLVRALSRKALERGGGKHGADFFVHIPEALYTNNRLSRKDTLDGFVPDAFANQDTVRIGGKRASLGKLSVIIPSKDNPKLLRRCVETFVSCAKDIDYELIVVDNGSSDENRMCIKSFLEEYGATYLYEQAKFNFSKMCNLGAKAADGDFLLFLNDDIEIGKAQQDGQWLHNMMRYAAMEHVGAVGIKLRYPDGNLIQHAGITNMGIGPAHKLGGMPDDGSLYHGHNLADYNMLAVTAACMMVSRDKFVRAGFFDEELAVAYNDVELCFRLYRMGLYNVQVNSAFLIHHESVSRGADTAPEKRERLLRERRRLYEKHAWAMTKTGGYDPFYSPNLVQWEKDAAYHVNYLYACEKPKPLKPLTEEGKRTLLKWFMQDNIRQHLERINVRLADGYRKLTGENRQLFHIDQIVQEDGTVTVTGWHVLRGKDNAGLTKTLLIFGPAWKKYEAESAPKLRRDVEALFAQDRRTKNTALSGICLKFDADKLPKGPYSIGIVVERGGRRRFVHLKASFEI